MDMDYPRRRLTKRARLFESRLRLLADNLAVRQEWRRLIVTHIYASLVTIERLATFRCKNALNAMLVAIAPNVPTDCKALAGPHSSVRLRKVEFCTGK